MCFSHTRMHRLSVVTAKRNLERGELLTYEAVTFNGLARDWHDEYSWHRWDEIDHQPTNSYWRHISAVPPPSLSSFFLLLSHLSADSVEREAGAKALARISPGRIRHPQIACFALLRPLLRELP